MQVAPQARGNGRPRGRSKRSTHAGDDSSGEEDPLDGFTGEQLFTCGFLSQAALCRRQASSTGFASLLSEPSGADIKFNLRCNETAKGMRAYRLSNYSWGTAGNPAAIA